MAIRFEQLKFIMILYLIEYKSLLFQLSHEQTNKNDDSILYEFDSRYYEIVYQSLYHSVARSFFDLLFFIFTIK